MTKTILITGSTDGIGLATALRLAEEGHHILLHGRSEKKLAEAQNKLKQVEGSGGVSCYQADLSVMADVVRFAEKVKAEQTHIDVLINNAGIFKTEERITSDGLDVRFAVNTVAPYLLTEKLLPMLGNQGRVINLSSAAQSEVNLEALLGVVSVEQDFNAYAQSKLAITMWSRVLAKSLTAGPAVIAVNPGSMLGTNMVQKGFGVSGNDISIGVNILTALALDDKYQQCSGQYFDNDAGHFADPHIDALDQHKSVAVVDAIKNILTELKL
ncbi:SDR family NAD(P)-dependent oxidoreductase [Neptuniibacter caesariensis]|uniref:Probable oxidoreductase n=1 Tax=Neptuniibacter caesariensis TaxID=207954 RepID=A0A7U8C698_NEPCE|nr:SDR family NAD(P)-dependent oxidoreductase [Neptuniibacter caesariensis]EAR60679.1 probable oxidoreductase [Neptuniibacter caesariensis]